MTWRKMLYSNKGTSIVIFSLILIVIIGCTSIVVDIGFVVSEKSILVNACDSAVLAGAQELLNDRSNAKNVAESYLVQNGVDPLNAQITIADDGTSISITASKEVKHIFAKVLGYDEGQIHATAEAKVMPLTSVSSGIRPFAVEDQPLNYSQVYVLKEGAGDGTSGNYGALALGGTGASNFEFNIINGYDGTLKVGDYVDTETGNMKGPTIDGVDTLIRNCNHVPKCTFENHFPDCPKIVTVVIVDSLDVNGRAEVKIVGFASFFLEEVDYSGGHTQITGRFIKAVAQGNVSESQEDFGLYGIKLIK